MVEGKDEGFDVVGGVRYRLETATGAIVPDRRPNPHDEDTDTEDDRVSSNEAYLPVPVFYPEDRHTRMPFEDFITIVEPVLERFGVGKVVPPNTWSPCSTNGCWQASPSQHKVKRQRSEGGRTSEGASVSMSGEAARAETLRSRADDLVIEKAIRQHATGRKGVYRTVLVEQKPMRVGEFRAMAEQDDAQPPRGGRGENKGSGECKGFDLEATERHFWKNVTYRPPIYGADVEGSLFDEIPESGENPANAWNIRNLDTILSKVLNAFIDGENDRRERKAAKAEAALAARSRECHVATTRSMGKVAKRKAAAAKRRKKRLEIPGVISPYLYFGMYRSFFAWHTEDVDLYSVNYLHFGEPKVWYCVPPEHRRKFESAMQSSVPELFLHCDQFLRHKELLASPMVLRQESVPLVRMVQRENEWVINYPGAYHAGFNCGFNCAESTNFATKKWVEIGRRAKACPCSKDSVRFDMGLFDTFLERKRQEREGEAEPEGLEAPLGQEVVKVPSGGDGVCTS